MEKYKVNYNSCTLFSMGYVAKELIIEIPDDIEDIWKYCFGYLMSYHRSSANDITNIEKI